MLSDASAKGERNQVLFGDPKRSQKECIRRHTRAVHEKTQKKACSEILTRLSIEPDAHETAPGNSTAVKAIWVGMLVEFDPEHFPTTPRAEESPETKHVSKAGETDSLAPATRSHREKSARPDRKRKVSSFDKASAIKRAGTPSSRSYNMG
ncbi:MAG: hypothetical protein OHK93_004442 [Ramalina farinacea]|uniref:Uncharacterized protein n=1 Tax=Ramalina farinacea TaxID=258253 RepID=A0AA43U0B0_9LECA|nr:hypothetical protein [Ramalina farinacea]